MACWNRVACRFHSCEWRGEWGADGARPVIRIRVPTLVDAPPVPPGPPAAWQNPNLRRTACASLTPPPHHTITRSTGCCWAAAATWPAQRRRWWSHTRPARRMTTSSTHRSVGGPRQHAWFVAFSFAPIAQPVNRRSHAVRTVVVPSCLHAVQDICEHAFQAHHVLAAPRRLQRHIARQSRAVHGQRAPPAHRARPQQEQHA